MHGPQQNTIAEGSSVLVGQALQRNNKVSQEGMFILYIDIRER